MLTSSNQYLRPEYLTPLPTTLDAKKSPLALLAQTCSQIGADTPNSKLLQAGDKSKSSSSASSSKSEQGGNKEKSSSGSVNSDSSAANHKISYYKPYESSLTREKSKTPEERSTSAGIRVRTPVTSKTNNSSVSNNSSGSGRCSSSLSVTASPKVSPVNISDRKTPAEVSMRSDDSSTPSKSSDRTSPTGTPTAPKSNGSTLSVLTSTTDHTVKDLPLGTFKPGVALPPTTVAYLGGYPPLGMDLMASSLMSHHALKTGSLSPYLAYARMKAPDPLGGICRDPYCTGCSLSSHLLSGAVKPPTTNCPAGCTQCDHVITSKAQSYLGGHNPAAAAYAHAQLAALAAASHLPYVCNWICGDAAYCGKRFSSSEELLSHLRTHTSVSSADGGGSANLNSSAAALSMLSATAGLPPTHPLFHRSYPTAPLSPLATARYHPYSKPSLLPPSLTSPLSSYAALGPPGLPPYLSPYSLYGPPRLGSTPSMHP